MRRAEAQHNGSSSVNVDALLTIGGVCVELTLHLTEFLPQPLNVLAAVESFLLVGEDQFPQLRAEVV